MRFKKLKGDASTVAKAMNGGIEDRIPDTPIRNVFPSAEFRYGPAIYNVKRVEDGIVKCKLTHEDTDDSDADELELPEEEVAELIKAYNTVKEVDSSSED